MQKLPRTEGSRDSALGGCTRFHVHWDPGQSSDFIGAWADLPVCLGGPPRKVGSQLWLTVGAATLMPEAPGNVLQHELSQRSPFWH